VYKSVMIGE